MDLEYDATTHQPASGAAHGWAAATSADRRAVRPWYPPCRAVVEFGVALVLLVLAAPVILLAALLVRLSSRGPAFYTQTRLGRGGRPYAMYKIRSMYHDCERQSGPRWASRGDPRVTPLGRVLRFTHVDELPQLVNVLKGEMSLIGPRPERPEFVTELAHALPRRALEIGFGLFLLTASLRFIVSLVT